MLYDSLRDYQRDCIELLRNGVRQGNRAQVLVAPTGGGKTVMASFLLSEAASKGSVAWFICDRVSLVDQTSRTLDRYGVQHGVIQADHWRYRPYEYVQVVSAQTLARRELTNRPKLIVWDECHTMYKSVMNAIKGYEDALVVGLTATPFTKGMSKVFSNVVNSTTTQKLISDEWLVPIKAYVAKQIDMTGAEVKFDGEWKESEIEQRGIKIVGDIVSEWINKTNKEFNGPVKTIVFSATVAHGQELCREFSRHGYNFQQVSYRDGNDDRRRALIDEFRKSDSDIMGLVSCEALAKGFDVPDILCGISARPYRKSLSGHIQQMGRVMRPSPGKNFALWLDHTGNVSRFFEDQVEFFERGVEELDKRDLDSRVRKEKSIDEVHDFACHGCGFVHSEKVCPSCGMERKPKKSGIVKVAGELEEFQLSRKDDLRSNPMETWQQICWIATDRKGQGEAASKFSKAQFKNIFGYWPEWKYEHTEPKFPTRELQRIIKANLLRYWKSKKNVIR